MSKNKSFSVGKIARVQSWNESSSAKFLGKSPAIKIVLIKLEVLVRSISKTELHQGYFPIHSLNFQYSFFFGTPMNRSRTIEPKKKLPPPHNPNSNPNREWNANFNRGRFSSGAILRTPLWTVVYWVSTNGLLIYATWIIPLKSVKASGKRRHNSKIQGNLKNEKYFILNTFLCFFWTGSQKHEKGSVINLKLHWRQFRRYQRLEEALNLDAFFCVNYS